MLLGVLGARPVRQDTWVLTSRRVWEILIDFAPRDRWLALHEIYDLIDGHVELDDGDRTGVGSGSGSARWKRTVRNALQRRKQLADVEWDGKGHFRLPQSLGS